MALSTGRQSTALALCLALVGLAGASARSAVLPPSSGFWGRVASRNSEGEARDR
jgi:hypothetical protein